MMVGLKQQLGRHSSTPLLTDSISNLSVGPLNRKAINKRQTQPQQDFDLNQKTSNLIASMGSTVV